MIKDPFVTEVLRIIGECCPRRYGERTIVLVSRRFYDAAHKELLDSEERVFGRKQDEKRNLVIHKVLALPAPWLHDYEFEIRPPWVEPKEAE